MDKAVRSELLDKLRSVDIKSEEHDLPEIKFLSTGFGSFDNDILGTGGLPYGRIIQLYGPEGSGKTLLSLRAIAMAQRDQPDKFVAYIDTEYTFDPAWAERQGVNLAMLRLVQSNIAEEALGQAVKYTASGACSSVVLDSIGNLLQSDAFDVAKVYKRDKKGEYEYRERVGEIPKKVTVSIKQIAKYAHQNQVLFIAVNQIRDKIGVLYGDPTDTPGGKALKHNLTFNIGMRRVEDLVDNKSKEVIGVKIAARMKKSKLSVCNVTDETNHLMFYFDEGIEKGAVIELYDNAVRTGVIVKGGAWMTWMDGKEVKVRWQGRDNALSDLQANEELRNELAGHVAKQPSKKPVHDESLDEQEGSEILS